MSEPQPTARPEAGPGYYECRSEGELYVRYWDGHELRINRESCNTEPLACYTDFLPLGVQPAGYAELRDLSEPLSDIELADSVRSIAAILRRHYGREEELRRALEDVIADLKNIVCVEEPDAGVVLLSNDGPSDWDEKQKCYVYRHQYFSPLGDALIALHEKLTAALNPKGPAV